MKKKYVVLLIIILVLLITFVTSFNYFKTSNNYVEDSVNNQTKITKGISMNLEQTVGAGDYKQVTQSSWPTEGYKFNTELSKCENGSTLSWDDTNKKVIVSGNTSDKCYVYFDIWIPPSIADYCSSGTDLATCVKNFGNQGPDISNIYIHNSSLDNGARDNSYRYAGASNNVNNYICLGSDAATCPDANLFRVIGVFGDKTKVIRAKPVGYQKWDTNNSSTWSSSSLNTYLNGTYLTSLGTLKNKIAITTWKIGGGRTTYLLGVPKTAYQYEVGSSAPDATYDAKIGLMYVSDYYYSASPSAWTLVGSDSDATKDYRAATSTNWLYLVSYEWTISREPGVANFAFAVRYDGDLGSFEVRSSYRVRPAFNLESSVNYVSGSGTIENPIRIN